MKTHLLYRGRDFDWEQALPAHHEALVQDLNLETIFGAMSGGDEFMHEVARQVMLKSFGDDIETIQYRQAIFQDCLQNTAAVRQFYDLAYEASERKRKQWFGVLGKYPMGILAGAIDVLQVLMDSLGKLRVLARDQARHFKSEGFVALFKMIETELPDEYFDRIKTTLKDLRFPDGILVSAELGDCAQSSRHTLRRTVRAKPKFLQRVFSNDGPPAFSFRVSEDDGSAKAISALRDRGINPVSNALAQSAEHIGSFFVMLRAELGFYLGTAALHAQLTKQGVPICTPTPTAVGSGRHTCTGLRDISLALAVGKQVTGNDLQADGKTLFMITGANQGGKSTFLRATGLAQVMMQSGMFVTAEAYSVALCRHVFTHFTREEDVSMKSGKFDEELRRMSAIIDGLTPDSLILFNESFSSTNEREGSEIASQIVCALLEARVKVFYVTHLYELAHTFWKEDMDIALFLRAERQTDGRRTFKLLPGEPLETSFGPDLYREIFEAPGKATAVN
ncbi:MAG: DNA mismatch repair protein MutS [Chthoniobacter sp.]|nr:DNA mismatch repair protein MutS [Chthoniobacter sp.]